MTEETAERGGGHEDEAEKRSEEQDVEDLAVRDETEDVKGGRIGGIDGESKDPVHK